MHGIFLICRFEVFHIRVLWSKRARTMCRRHSTLCQKVRIFVLGLVPSNWSHERNYCNKNLHCWDAYRYFSYGCSQFSSAWSCSSESHLKDFSFFFFAHLTVCCKICILRNFVLFVFTYINYPIIETINLLVIGKFFHFDTNYNCPYSEWTGPSMVAPFIFNLSLRPRTDGKASQLLYSREA